MPRPTATQRPPEPRRRRREPQPHGLFDAASAPEDESLLEDLIELVALGLVEERPTPDGTAFGLTPLGRRLPEFGA